MGWLSKTFGDLGSGIIESLGGHGHDMVGNRVGQWMNNITGTTDAFNQSVSAEWDFWNANNAYNSPEAVMQRYKDAGLNPNLIYGHGTNASASGSAPSKGSAGAGLVSSLLGYLKLSGDLRQQDAMTQNINAQRDFYTTQSNHLQAQDALLAEQQREAKYRADMAQHNFELIDGTDYILGENGTSRIQRIISGVPNNQVYGNGSGYQYPYVHYQDVGKAYREGSVNKNSVVFGNNGRPISNMHRLGGMLKVADLVF